MKTILTVLGARPQFIKAAAVSKALAENILNEVIVHTGQHYDYQMSDLFFEELSIPRPAVNLGVGSGQHGAQTGEMLRQLENEMVKRKPDIVMVYGDTNSTLAGALAASKLHIPVAHVESGLRSFNKRMPEEINRVLTDHMSQFLFTPTETANQNLIREGIRNFHLVGDVMYDTIKHYQPLAEQKSQVLKKLNMLPNSFALATIHRAENTDDPVRLRKIFGGFSEIAKRRPIVLPLHPRTQGLLKKYELQVSDNNIHVIEPVGYLDMVSLQSACKLMITDSGGVQKEAFFSGKYCITVREETEWVELVENGFNFLASPLENLTSLVDNLWDKTFNAGTYSPYGDGNSAVKIATILKKSLY